MGEVFPTHILAWGRYPFLEFIHNRKIYLIIWSSVEIKCSSTCVSTKLDTEYSVACVCGQNTWSHLHSTELARSEMAAHQIWYPLLPHSSLGLVATTLKPSSLTSLCYTTVSRGDPGIPQIPPLFPQEWLGTYLPFSLAASHPDHTHKQSYTQRNIQGGRDLRTSLVLLRVWSTLNSDRIAQGVILLGLENLQRWGFHNFSGHPVLVAFVLVEFHHVPSLAYSSSLPRSSWREALCLSVPTSLPQFAVICKSGKVALHLLLQAPDKDIKYYRTQDGHLRDSTCNQRPGSVGH